MALHEKLQYQQLKCFAPALPTEILPVSGRWQGVQPVDTRCRVRLARVRRALTRWHL